MMSDLASFLLVAAAWLLGWQCLRMYAAAAERVVHQLIESIEEEEIEDETT